MPITIIQAAAILTMGTVTTAIHTAEAHIMAAHIRHLRQNRTVKARTTIIIHRVIHTVKATIRQAPFIHLRAPAWQEARWRSV